MGSVTEGLKPMLHSLIQNFCVGGGGGGGPGLTARKQPYPFLMRKGFLVCLVFLLTYLKG